ncbi:MAG: hypothetical protein II008_08255 [Oscillospiraceae bacterium]|nr:hypothetical protein [Oscillospiraceae bacterium]
MADGRVEFEIVGNDKNINSTIKNVTANIEKESKKWDGAAAGAADGASGSWAAAAGKIAGALSAAGVVSILARWGKAAIESASDLAEVQNVVDVTFGEGKTKIESWSKSAGKAFGLTETQAKKYTSTLGAMMKSQGIADNEIVQMSTDLSGLAADMASFYNLDFDTAFQKIRAGISGETEPLKQLGINMSAANLEAFRLEKGITTAYSAMSQGEQTALRYEYIMKATADAQGDFARTSDGFANSSRRIATYMETIKTKGGELALPVVESLTGALASFLEKLTAEPDTTVLDDFAAIDLNTEKKLAQIQETATKARELTTELSGIDGTKLQGFVTSLSGLKLDEGNTAAVQGFLSVLSENIDVLADLKGTDAEGAQEWLDGIAESASKLDPEDADGWAKLIDSIKEGLPGLENTDFGKDFFAALGDSFASTEKETSLLQWGIISLGDKTNKTAQEQAYWLEICKRLVKTIPGLSSIINTETGEVKGGTQAIIDYVNAWEQGQTKLAMMGALQQKKDALAQRYAELPGLKLDMAVEQRRARQRRDELQKIYDKYGLTLQFDENGRVSRNIDTNKLAGLSSAQLEEITTATSAYADQVKKADDATKKYQETASQYDEAKLAMKEYEETVDEMPGVIDGAATATRKWDDATKKAATDAVNASKEILTALADYVQGVRDATEQSVSSVVKGFENLSRPTEDLLEKRDKLIRQQQGLNQSTKEGKQKYEELEKQINELNKSIDQYSTGGMQEGLKSQLAFMNEYIANLEKAKQMGLSNDLLASLSDGSTQSAEYLAQLVANPEQAKEVDALYQQVQAKKSEFTDALTEQKLTVDQTYQAMVDTAKQALADLNMKGEAKASLSETVQGIADGINDKTGEVQKSVDAIIAQLNRLSGLNISLNFGSITTPTMGGSTNIPSHETGLDFVPFDGYLSRLHEGEGILTAEENRIWQRFKNGAQPQTMDYDALGATMRDNVKAGGNVYLDGRTVGRVISAQQGADYRSLKRSGWQS